MFLNIPLIANWHAITLKREHLIHENLLRENQKRRRYDYMPQQRVLKKRWKPRKLDERTSGPYRVVQTHANGTGTIESRPTNFLPYGTTRGSWNHDSGVIVNSSRSFGAVLLARLPRCFGDLLSTFAMLALPDCPVGPKRWAQISLCQRRGSLETFPSLQWRSRPRHVLGLLRLMMPK